MHSRARTPVVTTREYGRVDLPARLNTARTRERLEAAALRAGLRTFESRGRTLHAIGVVGVIDVGDVIVEILPKVSDAGGAGDGAAFLGALLRFTGAGERVTVTEAGIADSEGGLLELILAWAASLADRNMKEGPPRRYGIREETSSAVRGRVELRHLARQRPGRGFELTVRHAPLGEDNVIGRTVKWLIDEILRRTRSLRTRTLCLRLAQSVSGVSDVPPTANDLASLILAPLEMRWHPLITLARTLMAQGRPDPARGGALPALAVLFTLHDLFEAAVRRVLADGLRDDGFSLHRNRESLLNGRDARPDLLRLKPDFRLQATNGSVARIVGDAKWKRILEPTGPPRLRESDAYQITAYLAALRADSGFLVSPLANIDDGGLRHVSYVVEGLDRPLNLIGVHLPTLIGDSAAAADLRRRFCRVVTEGVRRNSSA